MSSIILWFVDFETNFDIYFSFLKDYLSQVSVRLNPLIQAEVSVLVDVIRAPYALFPENNECRLKFLYGTFVHRYVHLHHAHVNSSFSLLKYVRKKNQKYPFFIIILSNESQLFRLINHTTLMLRKHQEKQLSFYVLNLLVDYARTMQHKRILHSGSNHEVDQLILSNTPCYLISFRFSSLVFMTFFFSCE